MALKIAQKKQHAEVVANFAGEAISVVAADYTGLTSVQMTELRVKARESNVTLKMVRNTLAKRGFTGTKHECLNEVLVGPVILAFSNEEPGAAARVMRDFAKDNDKLKVKALSLGDGLLPGDKLDQIAKLPTWDEAVAQLLSVMQAPIVKLARTIAEPKAKLARVLRAVSGSKQA